MAKVPSGANVGNGFISRNHGLPSASTRKSTLAKSLHCSLLKTGIQYCIDNKLDRFYAGIQGEHKLSRGFNPEFSDSFHFVKHTQFKEAIHDFVEREADLNELYKKELEQRSSIKY